ncbi:MAG: LysR family transcriptional regulator [Pseudomonadota bacterium]|nr:LysR family transcriptional regulator [Pseudomonadota bacterium]
MNLRALRYFVAIADAGSLTAAAAAVSVAQPALTRQLRELEADLGVQLLLRLPRGVRLTPAGVTLYESAQRMLAEAARVRQVLASRHADQKPTVVLGASPTLARVLLPGLFENCLRSITGIQLRAREAFTPALLDWLVRGVIDMAIVTNPEPGRALSLQPLLGEPFALVSHPSLKIRPVVSVRQLAGVPLLMTTLHRSLVDRQLLPLGARLQLHAEIDSVDSIRELVLRGPWATLMPISVFKDRVAARGVVISEISGVQLNRLLVLATRIEKGDSSPQLAIKEIIESEFARLARKGMFSFTSGGAA